ncbi:hypothetical protein KC331_g9 [Hortaea werneckii]|nr:hypothetical protein KC331_g9 [Hortaea werneckii]
MREDALSAIAMKYYQPTERSLRLSCCGWRPSLDMRNVKREAVPQQGNQLASYSALCELQSRNTQFEPPLSLIPLLNKEIMLLQGTSQRLSMAPFGSNLADFPRQAAGHSKWLSWKSASEHKLTSSVNVSISHHALWSVESNADKTASSSTPVLPSHAAIAKPRNSTSGVRMPRHSHDMGHLLLYFGSYALRPLKLLRVTFAELCNVSLAAIVDDEVQLPAASSKFLLRSRRMEIEPTETVNVQRREADVPIPKSLLRVTEHRTRTYDRVPRKKHLSPFVGYLRASIPTQTVISHTLVKGSLIDGYTSVGNYPEDRSAEISNYTPNPANAEPWETPEVYATKWWTLYLPIPPLEVGQSSTSYVMQY